MKFIQTKVKVKLTYHVHCSFVKDFQASQMDVKLVVGVNIMMSNVPVVEG